MTSNNSEIQALLESWVDACQAKDIDRLMSLYSPDIVYYDVVPPLQFAGSDEVRRNFLRWFDESDGPATGRRTIPVLWVQRRHFRVASVQVADIRLGSMLLVRGCLAPCPAAVSSSTLNADLDAG